MDATLSMGRTVERRRTTRDSGEVLSWVLELRVRPGLTATLVNLSEEGAVIETGTSLRPGAQAAIQLTSAKAARSISGQVVRSWVAAILPDEGGVRYRGALMFERPVDLASVGRPMSPLDPGP